MTQDNTKIKYFIYARKSSESEDRQVASIESQISELTKIAKGDGLMIVEILSESQSAKAPGRPILNKMIERIYAGEAQGIICWKLDRLARNPIDGGNISWMLQKGIIRHIQTHERGYYPTDNVLMMSVEFGMANQYILDLSKNVKRGLKTKCEKGLYPAPAPVGYINEIGAKRGEKRILPDPERFHLVRKMVDTMLKGIYTVPQILRMIDEEWGFTMPKGGKISKNTLYGVFTNPVYYGMFEYPRGSGLWYKGIHEHLMTAEEYDKIQVILGRKGKPRPKTHIFAFTGLMRCGECGAMITAEEKVKKQKNGNIHHYIYYHCTKRKNPNCTQKCIEQKTLEKQIKAAIDSLNIPTDLHDYALKWFRKVSAKESQTTQSVLETQQKAYKECLKKLAGLIDMRAAQEITEEEFKINKEPLAAEKKRWENVFNEAGQGVDKLLKKADEVFDFARDAKAKLENGDTFEKKEVFSRLGSNLLLKDRIVVIDMEETLIPLKAVATENRRLEPLKIGKNEAEIEELYAESSVMQTPQ